MSEQALKTKSKPIKGAYFSFDDEKSS